MSMIDCKVNVAKKEDPKGDRVVLTFECDLCPFPSSADTYVRVAVFSGKFLPYAKW
jgi:cyanate lyase